MDTSIYDIKKQLTGCRRARMDDGVDSQLDRRTSPKVLEASLWRHWYPCRRYRKGGLWLGRHPLEPRVSSVIYRACKWCWTCSLLALRTGVSQLVVQLPRKSTAAWHSGWQVARILVSLSSSTSSRTKRQSYLPSLFLSIHSRIKHLQCRRVHCRVPRHETERLECYISCTTRKCWTSLAKLGRLRLIRPASQRCYRWFLPECHFISKLFRHSKSV